MGRCPARWLSCAAALLPAATCTLAAQTHKLEPIKLATPVFAYVGFEWSRDKPAEAGAMPSFRTKEPLFARLRLGDKPPMLVAADLVTQGDATRCTVYLDTNWNGSLAGERPYPLETVRTADGDSTAATAEIRLPVRYHIEGADDVVSEYRLRLSCGQNSEGEARPPGTLCIEYGLSAMVDLGGETVRVTFCDATGDGKVLPAEDDDGDLVAFDKDPQGAPRPDEGLPLRPRMDYGGTIYDVRVRADGREATIEPYAGELATLILDGTDGRGQPSPVTWFFACNESDTVSRSDIRGPQSLLPGHYWFSYIIGGGDPEAHAFVFGVPEGIDLRAGEALRIACGGPLRLTVTAGQGEAEADALAVEVNLSMETGAGHAFTEAGREDAPGTVEVLDADGRVVAQGKAEYG